MDLNVLFIGANTRWSLTKKITLNANNINNIWEPLDSNFQEVKKLIILTMLSLIIIALTLMVVMLMAELKAHWQISKNGVSKSIVHVIKHVNFQLYRTHPDEIIWNKLTIDDKYINKRVWFIIHQAMSVSGAEKKKLFGRNGNSHLCEIAL